MSCRCHRRMVSGVTSDRDLGESPSPDGFTPNRESAALVVGQSKPSATELLLEDTVLFSEVVDHRVLLARDPSGHGGHEDLPWMEHCRHPLIVASPAAVRQLSVGGETG